MVCLIYLYEQVNGGIISIHTYYCNQLPKYLYYVWELAYVGTYSKTALKKGKMYISNVIGSDENQFQNKFDVIWFDLILILF